MGLLDSNRPSIQTFAPISYDMSSAGSIAVISNPLGYSTLCLQIKITKGADNVDGGNIRLRGRVSSSASWYQPIDVFDQYGHVYGSDCMWPSLTNLSSSLETPLSRIIYANVAGLTDIAVYNHAAVNATCEVIASLSDASFADVANRKPMQEIFRVTFTGDGETKNFGSAGTSMFRMLPDFKYLIYVIKASSSISGKLTSYDYVTDGDGDNKSFPSNISQIDGTSMITEWKENWGIIRQALIIKLDSAPADGTTIFLKVLGVR